MSAMDAVKFEQLVSEWLDAPERADLRERVETAAGASSALARLRDEWVRLDHLARAALPGVARVDWRRVKACLLHPLTEDDSSS